MSPTELDQFVTCGWVEMSTALLLWTVHLNLKVNEIIVPETLGDDRHLRFILFISLRACIVKRKMLDRWQPCCSVFILAPKCIYKYVIRTTEYIDRLRVKLTQIVGPTMCADKSWTIWHRISTMCKCVWLTWSHKICILVSVKHFSPTDVCVMTFTETDLSQTSKLSRIWTALKKL